MYPEEIEIYDMSEESDTNFSVKIVIVGDSGVGKSNILNRYVNNKYEEDNVATVGVELCKKLYMVNNTEIKLQIWDTAGQERFYSIPQTYFKGAKGAIIVYDISNKESYKHIDNWIKIIYENCGTTITIIVCGNKSDKDLAREVEYEEARSRFEDMGFIFFETSAQSSYNIENTFITLLAKLYDSTIKQAIEVDKIQKYFRSQSQVRTKPQSEPPRNSKTNSNCCLKI